MPTIGRAFDSKRFLRWTKKDVLAGRIHIRILGVILDATGVAHG